MIRYNNTVHLANPFFTGRACCARETANIVVQESSRHDPGCVALCCVALPRQEDVQPHGCVLIGCRRIPSFLLETSTLLLFIQEQQQTVVRLTL